MNVYRFLGTLAFFTLTWLSGFLMGSVNLIAKGACTPPPVVKKTYIVHPADGGSYSIEGTAIRGAGVCTEVMIGDMVDTRVCIPHVVTEALPTEPGNPGEPKPEPGDSLDHSSTRKM